MPSTRLLGPAARCEPGTVGDTVQSMGLSECLLESAVEFLLD